MDFILGIKNIRKTTYINVLTINIPYSKILYNKHSANLCKY